MTARMRVTCSCPLTAACRCGREAPVVASASVARPSWRALDVGAYPTGPRRWCSCGCGTSDPTCWLCGETVNDDQEEDAA